LQSLFTDLQVDSIFKVVPFAIRGDTIRILSDGTVLKLEDFSLLFKITFSLKINIDSMVTKLSRIPDVFYAEPNQYLYPGVDPDDPAYENADQWYLKQSSDEDIDIDSAWDLSKGDGIKIAIIDHGVRITHNDIDDKIDGGETTMFTSHGTQVSGVAGAETNNDKLMAGVAWNSSIIPYNMQSDLSNAIGDIYSALAAGADIINMSWYARNYSQGLKDVLDNVIAQGRIPVACAMNNEETPPFIGYPFHFNNMVIATTATNRWGNFVEGYNYGSFVDVSAPGYEIYTIDSDHDEDHCVINGTSFSAPIVSGIAALLKSYKPELSDRDIERVIELSAEDKGSPGWDNKYGYGRVNAYNALQLISSPNKIYHLSASGGSQVNYVDGVWKFYDLPGPATDTWYVGYRYEVHKNVSFGRVFVDPPEVWGRIVGTNGYYGTNYSGINYSISYCEPVPGTVTTTGATLRTYVYHISTTSGQFYGWYPCEPNEVQFAYTVLGQTLPLSVNITGPTILDPNEMGTFIAQPSGGSGTYINYRWWERNDEGDLMMKGDPIQLRKPSVGRWYELTQFEGYSSIQRGHSYSFSLKCEVTDSDYNTATDIHSVVIDDGPYFGSPAGSQNFKRSTIRLVPNELKLERNYPNPFNPYTNIKFGLPKGEYVELKVYAITGEEVKSLVDGWLEEGFHTYIWDGRDQIGKKVASGIYIYSLKTGEQRLVKKMLLAK